MPAVSKAFVPFRMNLEKKKKKEKASSTSYISIALTSEPSFEHAEPDLLTLKYLHSGTRKHHPSYLTWSVTQPSPFLLHLPRFTAHSTSNVFGVHLEYRKASTAFGSQRVYSVEEHQAQGCTLLEGSITLGGKKKNIRGQHSVNSLLPEREQS